jgi:hypothetical protein
MPLNAWPTSKVLGELDTCLYTPHKSAFIRVYLQLNSLIDPRLAAPAFEQVLVGVDAAVAQEGPDAADVFAAG